MHRGKTFETVCQHNDLQFFFAHTVFCVPFNRPSCRAYTERQVQQTYKLHSRYLIKAIKLCTDLESVACIIHRIQIKLHFLFCFYASMFCIIAPMVYIASQMVKIMLSDFKLYLFSIKVLYCQQCIVILNNLLSILVCSIAEYFTPCFLYFDLPFRLVKIQHNLRKDLT